MLLEENIGQDNHNYGLISLFEYLGQPARSELGKEVATYASKVRAKVGMRQVTLNLTPVQLCCMSVNFWITTSHSQRMS